MGILSTIKNRASLNYFRHQFSESELPFYQEINKYKGLYKVDFFNKRQPYGNMHESIYSGISTCKYEASLVALCEFFEREAVHSSGVGYSNGCAAQPVYFSRESSIEIAKKRAFNESVERFSFYAWFSDHSVAHSWLCIPRSLYEIGQIVKNKQSVGQFKISIKYDGYLVVSYIELEGGLLFGTALDQKLAVARKRSQSELLRNCLSYVNSLNGKLKSQPDKEIFNIAVSGMGFIRRILNPGNKCIKIPSPRETYELEHKSKKKVVVVRSLIDDTRYCKSTLCDNN